MWRAAGAALVVLGGLGPSLGLGPAGCALDEEQERVAQALLDTVEALDRGDVKALWEISAPGAQKVVLDLHQRLARALAATDALYPPSERAEARAALGEQLLQGLAPSGPDDQLGPALLGRLLDPEAMRLDDKARDGLRARGAVIEGDKATIHTAAGELFTFERVDGAWRSRLIADLLEQSVAVDRLRANADAVLEAQAAARKAWQESRDPRTPNGAYNALRAASAHAPPDGAVLYTLVDDEAREVLTRSLEIARKAQRIIQRKTKRAQRKKLYERHGLPLFVGAGSDRELLERWAEEEDFVPPVDKDDPPDRVEPSAAPSKTTTKEKGKAATKAAATENETARGTAGAEGENAKPSQAQAQAQEIITLVTVGGKRLTMRQDAAKGGYWRMVGYAPTLTQHLLARAQRALDALASGPKPGGPAPPR